MKNISRLRCEVLNPLKDAPHKSTIIWCHGLGDSSAGFADLFRFDVMPSLPNTRIVLPNAPARPVTINGGMVMQSWYDITTLDRRGFVEDERGINDSCAMLTELLDEESTHVDSRRIVVGGFSQGGAMALLTAFQYAKPLAGVVSCSAYLLQQEKVFPSLMSTENRKTPLLAIHGDSDPMVPLWFAQQGYEHLKSKCNVDVDFKVFGHMQHEVPEPVTRVMTTFFQSKLAADSKL